MLLLSLIIACFTFLGCGSNAPTEPANARSTSPMAAGARSSPSVSTPPQRLNQAATQEQTIFGVEEEIERPVSIPGDVLQILRQNQRNQRHLAQGRSPRDIPASWFIASQIQLNDDDSQDLIVMAANPRLFGANIAPFWIFRNTPSGHQLVLSITTLGLEVLRSKTIGYRDIRATAATAKKVITTDYVFDGTSYRERRSSQRAIRG